MKKFIACWSLTLWFLSSFGQTEHQIQGYVVSNWSSKPLTEAIIICYTDSVETYTNSQGYFNLTVSSDSVEIIVNRSGFKQKSFIIKGEDFEETQLLRVSPIENYEFTFFTPPSIADLAEVYSIEPDKIVLDRTELDDLPFFLSEPDIIKSLQAQPGVNFANDGFSDFTVRGGGLGQNLVLLDGSPVYSLGHFAGFVSNFGSWMAEDVSFYKAAFPARYGGRLASVTDIQSYSGNGEEVFVHAAISPILGSLNLGFPIDKKGSSLGLNFRRSYLEIFDFPNFNISYADFNAKLNLVINEKDRLSVSLFTMHDRYFFSGSDIDTAANTNVSYSIDLGLRNNTMSAKYSHIKSKRALWSLSAYYTNYNNGISFDETDLNALPGSNAISEYQVKFSSGEIGVNAEVEYAKSKKWLIRYGLQNKVHLINQGSLIQRRYDIVRQLLSNDQFGDTVLQKPIDISAYVENEYEFSKKLKFNAGLRATYYKYKDFGNFYPEPRISGRYLLNSTSSVRFSYARLNQFVHLYNTGGIATGDYISWLPATEYLKPQGSHIVTLSWLNAKSKNLRVKSEFYFKALSNQPIFYSADLFDRSDIEANSLNGTGKVIGWENSLKYTDDNTVFYLSATVSNANRKYETLNRGESFAFDYDRRFVAKGGFIFNLEEFILSANAIFATGNPFTLPTSKYRDINGDVVLAYDEINNYRAVYHGRVDVKIEYFFDDDIQSLEFMIYNMLGTPNVSSIYSERDSNSTNYKYIAYSSQSFTFFPFLTYKVRLQ